jgi:hypothetical protein
MLIAHPCCWTDTCLAVPQVARPLSLVFNAILGYTILGHVTSPWALACCGVIIFGFLLGNQQMVRLPFARRERFESMRRKSQLERHSFSALLAVGRKPAAPNPWLQVKPHRQPSVSAGAMGHVGYRLRLAVIRDGCLELNLHCKVPARDRSRPLATDCLQTLECVRPLRPCDAGQVCKLSRPGMGSTLVCWWEFS